MIKKTNSFKIFLYAILILITSYLIFNDNGLIKFLQLRSELSSIQMQIKSTEEDLISIENKIQMMKSNRDSIEKIAREKFNMKSEQEKVIIVNEN